MEQISESPHSSDRMLFLPKEHMEGSARRNIINVLVAATGLVIGFEGMHYIKSLPQLREIPLLLKASTFIIGPTVLLTMALVGLKETLQSPESKFSERFKLSLISLANKTQLLLITTNFGAGINCFLK